MITHSLTKASSAVVRPAGAIRRSKGIWGRFKGGSVLAALICAMGEGKNWLITGAFVSKEKLCQLVDASAEGLVVEGMVI